MDRKPHKLDWMTIGQIAERTGLAASAIRYYESEGLVSAARDRAGQRRFRRADLRRFSFIMVAQSLGFPLAEIRAELDVLPEGRAPSTRDWARISAKFRDGLQARIDRLTRLRDNLDSCIGCGCLSMEKCGLLNPADTARSRGPGARYVEEQGPDDPEA